MGITRETLKEKKLKPNQISYAKYVLDGYMGNDSWSVKSQKKCAIVLTGHPSGRMFLKHSVESHIKTGYWVHLAYDNYLDPKIDPKHQTYDKIMPPRDVFDQLHSFSMPKYQTWGGVAYPYGWLLRTGLNSVGAFPYIYCSNGDCTLDKPENFDKLFKLLGDADIAVVGWEKNNGRPLLNTTGFIGKADAMRALAEHYVQHFVPFETYEKTHQRLGNPESRLHIATEELGIKVARPKKNPIDTQVSVPGIGTWAELIGFRHIHGEYNKALRYQKMPPHHKYLDKRFCPSHVYNTIKEYDDTGNKKFLAKLWKQNAVKPTKRIL
jgi:hypothetical protein